MAPGFVTDVEVPAVRHAPLKKYQLLVLDAPVKSSLKVIACAWLSLAPRPPNKRSKAAGKYRTTIIKSCCWNLCKRHKCSQQSRQCLRSRHRRPHRPDRFLREYWGRPKGPGQKCKSWGWRNKRGWRDLRRLPT